VVISNAGKDKGKVNLSYVDSGGVKWYSLFGKEFGSFLQN
jgi:hypothetical protein